MSVRTIEAAGKAPVFRLYEGQSSPQPAFIELDCAESTLGAKVNGEVGNAVPFSVWHGH